MNTITLTNLQALTLEALTARHLPATAFWAELGIGRCTRTHIWLVDRVDRYKFTVMRISRKMKSKPVEWMS